MVRTFQQSLLVVSGLAMALSACSAGPLGDRMPESLGGLPAAAPARPATPYQYPAVHDMPAPRPTAPMTDVEEFKLENELRAVRDRQQAQDAQDTKGDEGTREGAAKKTSPVANKKAAQPVKKQPSQVIVVPPAGIKTNP
jgi:hypothetical protein